jgi:putative heme-binding domain-containing protein
MSARARLLLACLSMTFSLYAQRRGERQQEPARIPEQNPYTSASDVEAGRRIYLGRCGHCHGQSGEGGRGAALSSGRFRLGGSDRELFMTIRNGIPNTEMPGAFGLTDQEVWRVVAHVQQMSRQVAPESITGDAKAGAAVYESTGCAVCHTIGGRGGFLGPDLTDVGSKRAARHLRESILNPNADIPLEYRTVELVPSSGRSVRGIHLNEDEYSVHLRDGAGIVRSFLKSELKEVKLPRESSMPAYTSLSKTELENLVAYLASLGAKASTGARRADPPDTVVWTFDRLDPIGGHKTTILGQPRVIDSPIGKAVEFDGVDDALFIDNHPLSGARTFTWEAIFRPDGGAVEQRWFHLSEQDPKTGADTDTRMLYEIRVAGDQWYLDSFVQSGTESKTLMNRGFRHPLGAWYHVATVYDGRELRNYVDGVPEGAGAVNLAPQGPGHASVGVRINKVYYFKGAVHLARFTRRALAVSEFLAAPSKP